MISVGIDIGGTFTDGVAVNDVTRDLWSVKVPTTYPDPSLGFLRAIHRLLEGRGVALDAITVITHGTTLVSNAVIQRKGARTGLLTTAGFGDVLWIRDERRYDLFDVMIEFPEPLVARHHVAEIPERMRYQGEVVQPLQLDAVIQAIDRLVRDGVTAIAVCLLHAYVNPRHEARIASIIRERYPELHVSLSSEVSPESGEYIRMSTTVANAFVQPIIDTYLDRLTVELAREGFRGKLYVMLSNGGRAGVDTARRFPVQIIESGPAAGVLAANYLAQRHGVSDVLAFDMGGTTAKLSLIEHNQPLRKDVIEVSRLKRDKPGSGIPIKVPVLDLLEIGSGGGSIAYIDHMGLLKVGPESAGSSPGPACYGWGGDAPTVTDADLILGYLNPAYFVGGEMPLYVEAARRVIERDIAVPARMTISEAARGVYDVVNQNMALAARMHVLERGRDPIRYALVAYGGAGPVHAHGVARALGVSTVIVPPSAGVVSSVGFLVAPFAFDLLQYVRMPLTRCDWPALQAYYDVLHAKGAEVLRAADVPAARVHFSRTADMRFVGQGYEVSVALPDGPFTEAQAAPILAAFRAAYQDRYKHLGSEGGDIEFVRLWVRAWTPAPPLDVAGARVRDGDPQLESMRDAYFEEAGGYVSTPVYRWAQLPARAPIRGPAIIEAADTAVVVGPGAVATIDDDRYLVMTMPGA